MTRKLTSAVAIGAVAIGILIATAVPALGHEPRSGEAGVSPTSACPMAGDGMGSMMGMWGSRTSVGMTGPDAMGSMMAMMGPESMHSMMGMMGPEPMHSMMGSMGMDALDVPSGPVEEDTAVDPFDHAAHHPAATPEPTE